MKGELTLQTLLYTKEEATKIWDEFEKGRREAK